MARKFRVPLAHALVCNGLVSESVILSALSQQFSAEVADLRRFPPDPRLIDAIGAHRCLRLGILPWRRIGVATVFVTHRPERLRDIEAELGPLPGPSILAIASEAEMHRALIAVRGEALAEIAEQSVPATESSRNWDLTRLRLQSVCIGAVFLAACAAAPITVALLCLAIAMTTLVTASVFKLVAVALYLARRRASSETRSPDVPPSSLPDVSIIVPLYQENEIAPRLIHRLTWMDYPRTRLEICLVCEADDTATQAALLRAKLPPWMRTIVVPRGSVQTKPRALNFALDFCRGDIIGVLDAEDAPARWQVRTVVRRFNARGPEVACLQGVLDFYNRETNWLSRCFAIDYASWFRVILPALQQLNWVMPLGGTTLYFRRSALEALGRWDAHNVTEDADLGIRLARHGYKTEMIRTVTEEEANCRTWPWIRQRTRWIKGYAVTYAVHMRNPGRLFRELGLWRFFGVQLLFAGTLVQAILAPLLWTFWLAFAGVPHPLVDAMPRPLLLTVAGFLLFAEAATISLNLVALNTGGLRRLRGWVPAMHVYAMMQSIAAWKAIADLIQRPYYWDKTTHGLFDRRHRRSTLLSRDLTGV